MRRGLVRVGFIAAVFVLATIFLVFAVPLSDYLMPSRRGPDRLYASNDRAVPGLIASSASLVGANWLVGSLFLRAGISRERRSLFRKRRE